MEGKSETSIKCSWLFGALPQGLVSLTSHETLLELATFGREIKNKRKRVGVLVFEKLSEALAEPIRESLSLSKPIHKDWQK